MTIAPVTPADLPELRRLIDAAVRTSVTADEAEADFLVADIGESLDWWRRHRDSAVHLKYLADDGIAGVILVKNFWNLTNLFVRPDHYRQGVGRALFLAALAVCRERSPRPVLLVNSSSYAVEFYRRLGFRQLGAGHDRPGGCVPFEYPLSTPPPT